jgi:propanediol dehydratase small subunit
VTVEFDPHADYPLGARRPELVRTPGGLRLDEIGLDTPAADIRATPETLKRQAAVARAAGRPQLAENLERAAELALVPDDALLDVYTALRPHRSTAAELDGWAVRLEAWGAARTAAFVREAAAAYADRGLLAGG